MWSEKKVQSEAIIIKCNLIQSKGKKCVEKLSW